MGGKRYDIPMSMLVEVTKKVDQEKKKEESLNLVGQLKKGDWFYINKSGNAIVFKFEKVEGKKIIATNPIDNCQARIDITFQIGMLK